MGNLQKISFTKLLNQLSTEQVNNWWHQLDISQISEKNKKTNWKYFLQKGERKVEFKWALRNLAATFGYKFSSFNSGTSTRNSICEKFEFEIFEDLKYDTNEKETFLKHYQNQIKLTRVFQDFINYSNQLITSINIETYKIRMAITKKELLVIIGMRTVLSYSEKEGKAIIGFIVDNSFSTNKEKRYNYKGNNSQSFLEYSISNWNELDLTLLEENKKALKEQYNRVKNSKRITWNKDASTTNSTFKYLIFKNLDVENWIKNSNLKIRKIIINDNDIYKISMGKFLKEGTIDGNELYKKFEEKNIIVINKYTSKNQGNNFLKKLKIGDYTYLTYGQDRLSNLYQISSDNKQLKNLFPDLNSIFSENDIADFIYRDVKLIAKPVLNNTKKISHIKSSFYPSAFTTFKIVKDLKKANSILFQPFYQLVFSTLKTDSISLNKKEKMTTNPLNQVLYGPPGTGKTYHTINKALAIIEGKTEKELEGEKRKDLKERFENYVANGQIVFTTFHQSMSYEDFVEGIKPETVNDTSIVYNIKDGVFKQIADRANQKETVNFLDAYNKMLNDFDEKELEFIDLKTPKGKIFSVSVNSNNNLQLYTTENRNQQGTLTKERLEVFYKGNKDVFFGWQGYANGVITYLEDNYELTKSKIDTTQNYVLIIDEINRGNVSAIFGELITLLEEDKRLGKDEALTLTLPYSKKQFGVPANLHIIGTMNTADRSVEALDTALRRRFSFEEMIPKYNLKELETPLDVDLSDVLKAINNRIEVLLDRDHTIGHSYFINIKTEEDLLDAFQNKMIPLLQEYFYGDYDKIGLVLGDAFIAKNKNSNDLFAKYDLPNRVDFLQETFKWKELDANTIIDAVKSIILTNA